MNKNGSVRSLLEQPMNNHPSPLIIIASEGPLLMLSAERIEKRSDGRIEKRASVKVPVRIVHAGNAFIGETTTTLNISRHGARVLTSQRWRPGEQLGLASLSGGFRRQGKVIYCYLQTDGHFCVGLEFDASVRDWKDASWASVA
jgi:hypothetical protein